MKLLHLLSDFKGRYFMTLGGMGRRGIFKHKGGEI
jgi:hypothetical protein